MTGWIRDAVAVLAAALVVAFGASAADAPAGSYQGDLAHVYAYEAQIYDAPGNYAAPERGPPVKGYATVTYDADDRRSSGLSARPNVPAAPAIYHYDDIDLFVQVAPLSHGAEPAASAMATTAVVQRSGVAANSGMAGVRATGATGEAMAGIVKNTTRIPSASGKAAYRIPDELNSSVLGEVKNVSHLNYTSQLRDFAAYARQERLTFKLYTRGSTTFSSTLKAEINAGRIVLDSTRLGP